MDVVLDEAPVECVPPPGPARRPFVWYGVLGVTALALTSGVLFAIAVAIATTVAYAAGHPGSSRSDMQTALGARNGGSALVQLSVAALDLPIAFVVLSFLSRLANAPLEALGFRRLRARDVVPIVVAIVTTMAGSFLYRRILVALHLGAHRQAGFEHVRFHDATDVAVTFAVLCIVAPATEEIFFRVFLLNSFAAWMPFGAAVVLSAGIFACAHLDVVVGPNLFFTALVLTALYRYTRSIYASMIVHAFNNSLAFLSFAFGHHHA